MSSLNMVLCITENIGILATIPCWVYCGHECRIQDLLFIVQQIIISRTLHHLSAHLIALHFSSLKLIAYDLSQHASKAHPSLLNRKVNRVEVRAWNKILNTNYALTYNTHLINESECAQKSLTLLTLATE